MCIPRSQRECPKAQNTTLSERHKVQPNSATFSASDLGVTLDSYLTFNDCITSEYMSCGERNEDMIDHRIYTHNCLSCVYNSDDQ